MLRDLFIKTLDVFKFNTILIQPIFLFMLLSWFFVAPMTETVEFSTAIFVHIILLCALSCALIAGWLNMFNECAKNSDKKYSSEEERSIASFDLFKEFVPGVGSSFLNIFIAFILFTCMVYGVSILIYTVGHHYIGFPASFTPEKLKIAFSSESSMLSFVNALSTVERLQISKWNVLFTLTYGFLTYILMFWPIVIVVKQKNAFVSLFSSIAVILKDPFTTFTIYLAYSVVFFLISAFNALVGANIILSFIGLLLFIYAFVYFVLMLFLYYEQTFENISNSGTDGIGEDRFIS